MFNPIRAYLDYRRKEIERMEERGRQIRYEEDWLMAHIEHVAYHGGKLLVSLTILVSSVFLSSCKGVSWTGCSPMICKKVNGKKEMGNIGGFELGIRGDGVLVVRQSLIKEENGK